MQKPTTEIINPEKKTQSIQSDLTKIEENHFQKQSKDPHRKLRDGISREMVKILRHTAINHSQIIIRDDGFVKLDDLLSINKNLKQANLKMVQQIVAENDKKRFELIQEPITNIYLIRAAQGHSIKQLDEVKMMEKVKNPSQLQEYIVVHGTNSEAWTFIQKTGINKMSRNHIHFAKGYSEDKNVISGMRKTCDIFIEIDVPLAMQNGIEFFISSNGVILSSGINGSISPIYFKHVYKKDEKVSKEKIRIFGNDNLANCLKQFSYQYLFILDFEANCIKEGVIEPQEIIEFPIVVVDTIKNEILKDMIFHHYIKPDVHKLTSFCTELTGITQELVDNKGISIFQALDKFEEFVTKHKFNLDDCCFVTCGGWDLKTALKNETLSKKIKLNPFFKKFINVKEVFSVKTRDGLKKFGMVDMLKFFDLTLDGRHHSGIDDSLNIAKIVTAMQAEKMFFNREFTRIVNDN